jgi:hypothetical protein
MSKIPHSARKGEEREGEELLQRKEKRRIYGYE